MFSYKVVSFFREFNFSILLGQTSKHYRTSRMSSIRIDTCQEASIKDDVDNTKDDFDQSTKSPLLPNLVVDGFENNLIHIFVKRCVGSITYSYCFKMQSVPAVSAT